MDALLLNNVCKSFGNLLAVDNLNARIPAGAVYGFLGPNGAGKTTTLRMIMDIIRPDSGSIAVFGSELLTSEKPRLGYMPEERGLYRKMKVRAVMQYFGAIKGVYKADLNRRVSDWLNRVELAANAEKKVEELSRGMHQKLQFAVTVINDPDLLILDEPFSGLDPINMELLKSIILEMKERGKTVIFSTHVMQQAEELCDCILLINRGKAVLDGRLDDIRESYTSGAVSARLRGNTDFLPSLPFVTAVETQADNFNITMAPDTDPQQLLAILVDKVKVQRFEVKTPSLHEIFVSLVGADNAKDS
jgi:ABC-2 type transport system ATP-binding protein